MAATPIETRTRATIDDLMRVEGKAELIDGRIVQYMGTGYLPNFIAGEIYVRIREYSRTTGRGIASTDNLIYAVEELSSGRESISPDAAYYDGPLPADDMGAVHGPPTFAVEVRSKNDRGAAVEHAIAAKRNDYYEAGTRVVWDVDPIARAIRSYRADAPDEPMPFGPGDVAHAEPALPGWRVPVDDLFP